MYLLGIQDQGFSLFGRELIALSTVFGISVFCKILNAPFMRYISLFIGSEITGPVSVNGDRWRTDYSVRVWRHMSTRNRATCRPTIGPRVNP